MGYSRINNAGIRFCIVIGGCLAVSSVSGSFHDQVERDWLLQEQTRYAGHNAQMTTQTDAAGACDGVKDGQWGFHTEHSEKPWWQVDLGVLIAVNRIHIFNRCDPGLAVRNSQLILLISNDGENWRQVFQNDGSTFFGFTDNKPLVIRLENLTTRYVRVQLPGKEYLHLDEVEIFGPDDPAKNLALHQPADQSSLSQWSNRSDTLEIHFTTRAGQILAHCERLLNERREQNFDVRSCRDRYEGLLKQFQSPLSPETSRELYLSVRRLQRALTLMDPLLNIPQILFIKRVPGVYSHMSDQHYGWWSRPGGGVYLLRDFKTDSPQVECISGAFTQSGSFQQPALSYDGRKVLFAWCRYYPYLAGEANKFDKKNVPEDAFYHLFEMNLDGSGVRQLTFGKYDDFDGRYLPDGRIVFLSTRRGHALQVGSDTAAQTLVRNDLPDCYVRCGGGPQRPVAVYTLHTIDPDGKNINAISPFEMFEWTPNVSVEGTILYSRWDYIDRDNGPYMSLWSMNPDGTNARLVYKNYTRVPHCTFEPQSVPGSHKILFTGSGHHSQTMGSLVLLDPTVGTEGSRPITRLTPEVVFPEIEGWSGHYFTNPHPLSERMILVCWGKEDTVREGSLRISNGMGLYVFDAATGDLELLHRDPEITSATPLAVTARPKPPVVVNRHKPDGPCEGTFLLTDVYQGLKTIKRGDIQSIRIIAIPPKTHPTMDYPSLGMTREETGKTVLGTVPVEADGSAFFRVPAGVIVFFQAIDIQGIAVQTMRSATYVQPGQTLSCVGCHESRQLSPDRKPVMAARREPSRIFVGPVGSWPYRYDKLVQPVLDRSCVSCHKANANNPVAARFVLTPDRSYESLTKYGTPSLFDHVWQCYREGVSVEGHGAAAQSAILNKVLAADSPCKERLDADGLERLIVWMDTLAQKAGQFDSEQEKQLTMLRNRWADLLIERPLNPTRVAGLSQP